MDESSDDLLGHAILPLVERVFVGSEALARGTLTRHELRTFYRRVLPDVYAAKGMVPTLEDRTVAAWLWSGREGVVNGLTASALPGAKWVDDGIPIELNWGNHRPPAGVVTRNDTLLDHEVVSRGAMSVTTAERTAFDLGCRGPLGRTVARLDSLARATRVKVDDVKALALGHPHVKGLRQLDRALDLVDAGAESPQETRVRLMLIGAGLPRPQTQMRFADRTAIRTTTSSWVGRTRWSRSNTTAGTTPTVASTPRTSSGWSTSTPSGGSSYASSLNIVGPKSCTACARRANRDGADGGGHSHFPPPAPSQRERFRVGE